MRTPLLLVGGIILLVAAYFVFIGINTSFILQPNEKGKIGAPTVFYNCYNISEKIELSENTIHFGNERCKYSEKTVNSNLIFFTESDGSIGIKKEIVLEKLCENIIEKVSGFELTDSGTQGIFLDAGDKVYYCGGLANS